MFSMRDESVIYICMYFTLFIIIRTYLRKICTIVLLEWYTVVLEFQLSIWRWTLFLQLPISIDHSSCLGRQHFLSQTKKYVVGFPLFQASALSYTCTIFSRFKLEFRIRHNIGNIYRERASWFGFLHLSRFSIFRAYLFKIYLFFFDTVIFFLVCQAPRNWKTMSAWWGNSNFL